MPVESTGAESAKPDSRKSRKKQAVGTTYDAAIIAIVRRNASTSMLLKMPAEVLDNILRYLLGDRMIHICHFKHYELKQILPTSAWRAVPDHGSLVSAFCVADRSEQQAYNEAVQSEVVQTTEDPDYIQTCKDRHRGCLMCNRGEKKHSVAERRAGRLTFNSNLSVLAVCRLLYEESNNILWQTNTFSFDDPFAFQSFLASMNCSQKHKLKKIHISMPVKLDETLFRTPTSTDWANVISPRALTPLINLNIIHLSFDQHNLDPKSYTFPMSHAAYHDGANFKMEMMLGLRLLPWKDKKNANRGKHVTVVISDDITPYDATTLRWTKAQKLEVAEKLRARLAAPDAAEIHDAEKKAAMIAKEEKEQRQIEKDGRAYVCNRQDLITKLQSQVEHARAEVESQAMDEALCKSRYEDTYKKGLMSEKVYSYRTAIYMNARKKVEKMTAKLARMKAEVADLQAHPDNPGRKKLPEKSDHFYYSD